MSTSIAIIGLSGRYSNAKTPDILWEKLKSGEDLNISISKANSDDGSDDPSYVNRCANMNDIDCFDNEIFNCSPYEAMITDPQQRIFLECCFHALEDAGYAQDSKKKCIGVFGSTSISTYLLNNIMHNQKYADRSMLHSLLIGNDKDFLATRVSYKLNLSGPSITIQSACSGSLVALNYAYQSLLNYECDAALVGGVSITIPQNDGYIYQEGMIFSKDGFCRPFDNSSSGTIKGNGCSVILIKRLEDAQRDNDHIYAILKGTAVNNDASNKIGFTAPSVEGQSDAIKDCLSFADVNPTQIDYIEAHGTGTRLGDPIEIRALSNVFRNLKNPIPIGSIKANIGHLDCAAGMTSLIKCIYMLRDGIIPPNIYFKTLNTEINNSNNLFYFPNQLEKKKMDNIGISSFGIGGTNAHAVISAYHETKRKPEELPYYLLPISFLRKSDFEAIKKTMIDTLETGVCMQDFIYTMSVGRKRFPFNIYFVFSDRHELIKKLKTCSVDKFEETRIPFPSVELSDLKELACKIPLYKTYLDKYKSKITTEKDEFVYSKLAFVQFLDAIGAVDSSHVETNDELDNILIRKLTDDSIPINPDKYAYSPNNESQTDDSRIFKLLFEYIGQVSIYKNILFNLLYKQLNWGRISAPLYPLAKKRFWIEPDANNIPTTLKEAAVTTLEQTQVNCTEEVIKIWEDVLNIQNIQPEDDYYDIGGDSLLAISILSKINERFSLKFDLKTLLNCTTPLAMSKLIQNTSSKVIMPSFISKIRTAKSSNINLFLIHPAGGTTFCYHALNTYLTCDVTIYGLDLPDNYSLFSTMEELASFYINEIVKIQSEGNFFLGGYSFGGNLAYEIARQLQNAGKHVANVLMFESLPPDSYYSGKLTKQDYNKAFPNVIKGYFDNKYVSSSINTANFEEKDVHEILKMINTMNDGRLNIREEEVISFYNKWIYNCELLKKHRPKEKLDANVIIFEGDIPNVPSVFEPLKVKICDKHLWQQLFIGQFELRISSGNHFTMFSNKEYINKLATEIDKIVANWNGTVYIQD